MFRAQALGDRVCQGYGFKAQATNNGESNGTMEEQMDHEMQAKTIAASNGPSGTMIRGL